MVEIRKNDIIAPQAETAFAQPKSLYQNVSTRYQL